MYEDTKSGHLHVWDPTSVSTVVEHQLKTVHSMNKGTNMSFGSPGCGSGLVELVFPSLVVPAATQHEALISEANTPGPLYLD